MKVITNVVHPTTIEGRTKGSIQSKIKGALTFSKHSSNAIKIDSTIVAVQYQKLRKKSIQKKVKDKEGKMITKSKVIRNGSWIGKVYRFDENLLKLAQLKVVQNKRSFTLEKIK